MADRIYLDHAATTSPRDEVIDAMRPFLERSFGNPSSLHAEGRVARDALERARRTILESLGACGVKSWQLAFTGGGTEADSAAILGVVLASLARGRAPGDLHVVASAVEHAAVLGALECAALWGVRSTLVPVDRFGRVDLDALDAAIRPETVLVSVMSVNNELGTIQALEQVSEIARRRGVPLHSDAIQALGKMPLDLGAEVGACPADLVTLSAHKISGPKGCGALLVRDGVACDALLRGGAQESGLRAGTQGVAGAVGFARAVELAVEEQPEARARLAALRDRLVDGITKRLRKTEIRSPNSEACAPHIASVSFHGIEGESLLMRLDDLGVAVSTGSACNVGAKKPSHVLEAIGLSASEVRATIRFSVGRGLDAGDIDRAVDAVTDAVESLRAIAPGQGRPR